MTDERRGIRSRPAVAALLVVALAVGGWLVVNSPVFGVQEVSVRGVRHLDAEEVRALAAVEDGRNLIRLSLDEIAVRIERHPWVADAGVRRDLPSTLVIEVRERRPSGWLADGERALVVAGDGVVLDRLEAPPRDLPGLGEAAEGSAIGERLIAPPSELRVASSMPAPLLEAAGEIEVAGDEVTIRLRGGGEARYGAPAGLTEKHRALGEILEWAEAEDLEIAVIDVRVPSAPTLEPVRGEPSVSVPKDLIPSPSPSP
jgi:cell division protein FtsQ